MKKKRISEIKSYTDLSVWQEAHKLTLGLHHSLPSLNESSELTNFLKRYSIRITENIAKGYYKKSFEEKLIYYYDGINLATSIENALIIAKDMKYITPTKYDTLNEKLTNTKKYLFALIKKIRKALDSKDK